MPIEPGVLALEPAPRSVQRARHWVADLCRARGRDDLVESAEAGVSELVTNALLHAPGPISVRLSGTPEHPRVEVHDVSPVPPRPLLEPPAVLEVDDPLDALLSTVGRGLRILATSALAWGAETRPDGKVVWFEPAPEPRTTLTDADLAGVVYAAAPWAGATPGSDGGLVEAHLLGVPVVELARFRRHHLELRRELRLLALAHAEEYPQAERLSALFADFERDLGRTVDSPAVLEALSRRRSEVDLTVAVPAGVSAATAQMIRLLDLADEFCDAARLLTLARTPGQRDFARWFLTQVGEQADGAAPVPWSTDEVGARYSST